MPQKNITSFYKSERVCSRGINLSRKNILEHATFGVGGRESAKLFTKLMVPCTVPTIHAVWVKGEMKMIAVHVLTEI